MRRILVVLTLAVVMAAMMVAMAMPAFADKGGYPKHHSCGVGGPATQGAIQDPTSPGATEFTQTHPSEASCTGKG